ncbi:MAG: excinuclease ABC subunit C [Candidatus Levybacteria bacterium CG10_big_fil_rev_8_21_14_0_10_35_13]|nr:MAG: excinuclease ABC subunit C [Candidatus Levybacteria bacterium CG10_big_fil_rev_8_21_14_0_10_35_13]
MRQGCTVWYVPFFYVYVLQSKNKDFIYVGITANLKKRFFEHNNKEELSTKAYTPLKLIFYEAYRNEKDARRREEYFKTTKGKTTLRMMLREYFKNNSF